MMSLIAFKSLRLENGRLYSPSRNTKWERVYSQYLCRPAHSLSTTSLDGGQGIHAATICEAWRYMGDDCRLFLVAPDPDAETEIGTKGWRTTCALVLGDVTSVAKLREAANLIVASHQAGYPQVKEILRWAHFTLAPKAGLTSRDLVVQSSEVRRMVRAAAWGQFAKIRRGTSINEAGVTWSTPIKVVSGDEPPTLVGEPSLKTKFRIYIPSTLQIEVGEDWPPLKALIS